MDRAATIAALIAFDRPLPALAAIVDALPAGGAVGAASLAILRRDDIAAIVRRHLAGEIAGDALAAWAEMVECREEIDFEPRHEEVVADALYDLADPDAPLAERVSDILARLTR